MARLSGANRMAWQRIMGLVAVCATGIGFASCSLPQRDPSESREPERRPARTAKAFTKPAKITLDDAGVLVVDGKKVFPITLTIVPGPDAKAPNGKHAYGEFAGAGVMFMRTGGPKWDEKTIEQEKRVQAAAARGGGDR